jgi:hypothetical protein
VTRKRLRGRNTLFRECGINLFDFQRCGPYSRGESAAWLVVSTMPNTCAVMSTWHGQRTSSGSIEARAGQQSAPPCKKVCAGVVTSR